ncbi:VP2 [Mangshi virus]|nr:VP2 [Mangshi virus]
MSGRMPRKGKQGKSASADQPTPSSVNMKQTTATEPVTDEAKAAQMIQNPKAKTDVGDTVMDSSSSLPVIETQVGDRPQRQQGAVKDGRSPQLEVQTVKNDQVLAQDFKNIAFDPMTIKNNTDTVAKLDASQKSSLQEVLPTREISTSMVFGTSFDDLEQVYAAANKVGETATTTAYTEVKRDLQQVRKMSNFPHNLQIVSSENGRHSLIMERLGDFSINTNVDFKAQAGMIAIKLARMLGIDKPFVFVIGGNYVTEGRSYPTHYSNDGLSPRDILVAINRSRRFNNQSQMQKRETVELLQQSMVFSNVDGSDTSVIFCGSMTATILNYAAEQWAENTVPLTTYVDEIRATLPEFYQVKGFTELERKHGYVYRERDQGSLMPLVNANLRDVSSYYFKKLMTGIEDVPVNVVAVQSATAMLSADVGQSTMRAQHVSMLTGSLTTMNAPRMRAITALTCMFPQFNVDMVFAETPTIKDACAAACLLLFRPAHCISDALHHYCLAYLAAFLKNTTTHVMSERTSITLRTELNNIGWNITERYEARRQAFRHEPLRSPGVRGEYFVPFNIDPLTGRHVETRLDDWLQQIGSARFRNNPGVGVTIAAFLRKCMTQTQSYWQNYATMIARYRGLIPDELYRSLRATPGDYCLPVADEYSFFFTLADIDLTDNYIGSIDKQSDEYLAEYATLARDISLSLTLVNAIFKEIPRDSGSVIAQVNAMNTVIQQIFSNEPFVSDIMLALLSVDAVDGKEDYRNFLNKMIGSNAPIYREPAIKILDFISGLVLENGTFFGQTQQILILPRAMIVDTDRRFGFRDSPFVQRMPTQVMGGEIRRMSYTEFVRLDRARTAIEQGLLIDGAYFNYEFKIVPEDGVSRLENDIFLTTNERNEIKPIKFIIHFENYDDPALEDQSGLNISYKLYIVTPACLVPMTEYQRLSQRFTSPSSSRVYMDKPALVYSRV